MDVSLLSLYERQVIDRLIPLLRDSIARSLHITIINLVYSDHLPDVNTGIISHQSMGERMSLISQHILDCMRHYKFISKREDGSYELPTEGEVLIKAGSLDEYLKQISANSRTRHTK